MKKCHLTASEAAELLDISVGTLYAYVSRGLIRSETAEGDSRARRYNAEDVHKLKERKAQRQNPAVVAESALDWGTPILESALTLITEERLYYRGYDALALAQTHTLEQVAALLWLDDFEAAPALFTPAPDVRAVLARLGAFSREPSLTQRMFMALVQGSEDDLAAYDLGAKSVAQTGARILRLLAATLVNDASTEGSIVDLLQRHWFPSMPEAAPLLNAALILCADHELNASSFAARVAASTETQPYGVVIAGLAAAQGAKHGGNTERVEALLREIGEPSTARRVIADRLRRGERIPGFGHRLYPNGDPRAAFLLGWLRESYANAPIVQLADAAIDTMRDTLNLAPNIDLALVVLARLLEMPRGAGLALFSLGRTVGWIGHAIEQYRTGQLIRPRARYTGMPPREKDATQ